MVRAKRKGDSVVTGYPPGRPRKNDPPRVPYNEIDRMLVFGEIVPTDDGESTTIVYPTYRDLALRYGVSNSVIAAYAKRHKCLRRREFARARVSAKVDEALIQIRAETLVMSREDELRIIDKYLVGFEKAMAEDRVRFDSPTDFNTMARLKEFLQGGADSRQEVHASLSLDEIQSRHRSMMQSVESSSAAERGDVGRVLTPPGPEGSLAVRGVPPAVQPASSGRFPGGGGFFGHEDEP